MAIKSIKKDLNNNFTKKWSSHVHENDHDCNTAIVIDGLWKCFRSKCAFENAFVHTEEFGDIQTGCVQTPAVKHYYCDKHKDHELVVRYRDRFVKVKPQNIRVQKLCKNFFFK